MPSTWIQALKEWNGDENKGMWCVPRKGSAQLDVVRGIVERIKMPESVKASDWFKEEGEPLIRGLKQFKTEYEKSPTVMTLDKYKKRYDFILLSAERDGRISKEYAKKTYLTNFPDPDSLKIVKKAK